MQNTIKRLYDAEIDQFDLYNAVKELITTRGATQDTIRMKVTDPLRDSIDYVDNPSRLKDKLRDMFPRIHRVNDLAEILNIHPSNLSTFLNKIQMGKSSVIGEGFDYAMAFHFKTEMNREKIFEFLNRPRKRKKSSHKSSIDKKKTT